MAKLHEVLAVEGQLKGQAQATRTELAATFEKKRHLFEEKVTVFHPHKEGAEVERHQQSDLQTTVRKELAWIRDIWAKALDVSLQVQKGCATAKGDVVLDDGRVVMRDVPVLALLELEKRTAEFQELVKAVPTLDPAKGFSADPARGEHVYKARDVVKRRTAKEQRAIVLYDATKEHPAQTQLITQDVEVGKISEQEWSGMITPAEKADMLTRAEELRRAVKKARMRANDESVPQDEAKFGASLLDYVFTGTIEAV